MISEQEAWDMARNQTTGTMYVTSRDAIVRKDGIWQYMANQGDPALITIGSIARDIIDCQNKGIPWSFI